MAYRQLPLRGVESAFVKRDSWLDSYWMDDWDLLNCLDRIQ
jgi:hypothetical protein